MKEIKSYPGASIFRSYSVLIIVLLTGGSLFLYLEGLEKQVEIKAIEKTVNEINATLALTLYKKIITGHIQNIPKLADKNPFELNKNNILIINYKGSIDSESDNLELKSWYFNSESKEIIYHSDSNPRIYKIEFSYQDNNKSKEFEYKEDVINGFFMKEKRA